MRFLAVAATLREAGISFERAREWIPCCVYIFGEMDGHEKSHSSESHRSGSTLCRQRESYLHSDGDSNLLRVPCKHDK